MKHVPIRVVAIAMSGLSAAGRSRSRARRRVHQLADRKQRASARPRCRPGQSEGRPTSKLHCRGQWSTTLLEQTGALDRRRQELTSSARPRSDLLSGCQNRARRQRAGRTSGSNQDCSLAAAGRGDDRDRPGRREPDPRRPERLADRLQSLRHRLERGRRAASGATSRRPTSSSCCWTTIRPTPASIRR